MPTWAKAARGREGALVPRPAGFPPPSPPWLPREARRPRGRRGDPTRADSPPPANDFTPPLQKEFPQSCSGLTLSINYRPVFAAGGGGLGGAKECIQRPLALSPSQTRFFCFQTRVGADYSAGGGGEAVGSAGGSPGEWSRRLPPGTAKAHGLRLAMCCWRSLARSLSSYILAPSQVSPFV